MAKPGPKLVVIDWEEFDKLVSFQCTQEEIAHFFDCSVDTLDRAAQRERGMSLADLWDKKRAVGRIKLRKIQFGIAEGRGPGAATMAIYLDKKMNPQENPDRPAIPPPAPAGPTGVQKRTFSEFCVKAGYPAPFPKQEEMRAFIFDETDPRLLLGSRGYGKTDYLTILGVAYDIYLHGVAASNLIITKAKARNAAIMDEIAKALEANDVVLSKKNASCVQVEGRVGKDYSAEAVTIKTSLRGRHPYRTLMDDPVTEEDVSEAMRKLVKRKYDEVLKLCANVGIIGQPAHAFDLYASLRPLVRKLEVPHGTIPELDHDLEAQRLAGVDEKSIQASYFLQIIQDGTLPFQNLKFIDQLPEGDSVAFVDPSDGGDFTAVSIFKGYLEGVAVEGYAWQRPWYHCMNDLVPLLQRLGVRKLAFETNATGRQPIGQLQEALGPLGIGVTGINSDTNKHMMIMAAGSVAHMIHLSKRSNKPYSDQVTMYEDGAKYDDSPDSLARGLQWLGLLRGRK